MYGDLHFDFMECIIQSNIFQLTQWIYGMLSHDVSLSEEHCSLFYRILFHVKHKKPLKIWILENQTILFMSNCRGKDIDCIATILQRKWQWKSITIMHGLAFKSLYITVKIKIQYVILPIMFSNFVSPFHLLWKAYVQGCWIILPYFLQ